MVDPRSPVGARVERPAHRVLHQARLVLRGRDLPQLLDAQRVGRRVAVPAQVEALDHLLGHAAAASLGQQRVGRAQLHAGLVVAALLAFLGDPHVAGGHTRHPAILFQHLGRSEPRVDLHPQRFRLRAQPAAHVAEADDVVALVVHLRRGGKLVGPAPGHVQEPVFGRLRAKRRVPLAPVRQQLVQRPGLDHRARQDVGADLAPLLHHAHRHVRRELLDAYRSRKPGRASADDGNRLHASSGQSLNNSAGDGASRE